MIPLTYVPVYAQVAQFIDGTDASLYAKGPNTPLGTVGIPVPGSSTVKLLQ